MHIWGVVKGSNFKNMGIFEKAGGKGVTIQQYLNFRFIKLIFLELCVCQFCEISLAAKM